MKAIAIGDIHGRVIWKEIINKEPGADKIIFVADYFDSFDIPGNLQHDNFLDILEFKKSNPDKVELLIGNHDYHYMEFSNGKYSGFQHGYQYLIKKTLTDNLQHMKICYHLDDVLFVHAGVTKTWCKNAGLDPSEPLPILVNNIQELFVKEPDQFGFIRGSFRENSERYSPYGDNIFQSPLWVRPGSLALDAIGGCKQVVGHTYQPNINIESKRIHIDVLDTVNEYLIYEDGIFSVGKIK